MKWTDSPPRRRRKYAVILEQVAHHQTKHPGQWALIAEFRSSHTAADAAYRLRKEWEEFQFQSMKTEMGGIVLARYNQEGDQ